MLRSLSTAISGLRGHQIKLDVIGNNIANVNTVAYKKSQTRFEDLLSQTMQGATAPLNRGGMNPTQVGMGMRVSGILANHYQGPIQNTDRETDLAIEGEGYFVLFDGQETLYSRDGSFGRDATGNLVNINGLTVMGYVGEGKDLSAIHIPLGEKSVARATSSIAFSGNLDAMGWQVEQGEIWQLDLRGADGGNIILETGDGLTVTLNYSDTAGTIESALKGIFTEDGEVTVEGENGLFTIRFHPSVGNSGLEIESNSLEDSDGNPLGNDFLIKFQDYRAEGATKNSAHSYPYYVFDSQGRQYFVEFVFTPTEQNTWEYQIFMEGEPNAAGSGILLFNKNGNLDSASIIPKISVSLPWAEDLEITPDFSGCTQLAGLSSVRSGGQNGFPTGELISFDISRTGVITGTYSNGMVENLGQVALAFFTNPEGLIREGGNLYQVTSNSGEPQLGVPGTEGRGLIRSSSLEMSNADVAVEFTELITTSRAFQANTRMITASDEILMEVINMKR